MNMIRNDCYTGHPPFHPIAYHAGHAQEGLRISNILQNLIIDLKVWFQTRQRQRIDRQAFDSLLGLDDKMLHDIGVSRSDVVWASRLPVSANASAELEIIARQNRKQR